MGESTDGIVLKQIQTLYNVGAIGGLSDSQLGEHVLAGRDDDAAEAAFTILAERHGPMVFRICRQMLRDRHDVEDAFQATFLVLASKAHSIRNRDSLASWLHGVARRVALRARADAARRRIHERRRAIPAEAHSPEDDDASHGESWPELHEEIARLPVRYREPIVLCYLEGLTTEAASQRLGCPQGTILSRLSRARERLRKGLTRRGLSLPAGLLTLELCRDVAMAVPAALLNTTVRASLSFTARQTAGATVASASAVGLARGVLYAMTLSQWKTFGAATLACVLTMGGLQVFAQFGGIGADEKTIATEPVADDRPAALTRSVAKIQDELDEANRRNAELQKQLQVIHAELKALRASPAPVKEAKPAEDATAKLTGPPNNPHGAIEHQGRNVPNRSSLNFSYTRSGDLIFMISSLGDKFKTYNTSTGKSHSRELPASKEFPLKVTPMVSKRVATLMLEGQRITQLFASGTLEGPWFTQDLREPVNGVASPIVGNHEVLYVIGRYAYAFSAHRMKWDILELPEGTDPRPRHQNGAFTFEGGGHIFTFDAIKGGWTDFDIKAIFDAPDTKEPGDVEPPQPPTARSLR